MSELDQYVYYLVYDYPSLRTYLKHVISDSRWAFMWAANHGDREHMRLLVFDLQHQEIWRSCFGE